MEIVRAKIGDLEPCVDILFDSRLGQKYYPKRGILKTELEKGIHKDCVSICKRRFGGVEDGTEAAGIIWYQFEGMFHSFPYLHMIAVKKECQGQGIGKSLMDFFEQDVLVNGKNHICTKAFLTVADFNSEAENWYQRRGYVRIGEVVGLFRKNISERIMMKLIAAKQ